VADYQYNPQQAKQLLAQATRMALTFSFGICRLADHTSPTQNRLLKPAAELSAIGIKVSLQTKDWAAYLKTATNPWLPSCWAGQVTMATLTTSTAHFGPGATADLGAGKSASLQALGSRTRKGQG